MASNSTESVKERIARDKKVLLAKLKSTPVIQIACKQANIGRATYYRWRKDDPDFAAAADEALCEGTGLINDMAESMLINGIKDRNLTSIIFWLKHHHPAYESRVKVSGTLHHVADELTESQAVLVRQALEYAGLLEGGSDDGGN